MAGVVAWPACSANGHPCKCFRVLRLRTPWFVQPASQHKQSSVVTCFQRRSFTASATPIQQPVQEQDLRTSKVAQTRHSFHESLEKGDTPQESAARQDANTGSGPRTLSQESSANVYTKADRASLATIPEEQMSPEMLRRWRISKANKGKQPWNKGRQHSPETLARIREGTKAAMMRPEVLARVRANHPSMKHTSQSKAKIGASVAASRKRIRDQGSAPPDKACREKPPTANLSKKVSKDPKPRTKVVTKTYAGKGETLDSKAPEPQPRSPSGSSATTSAHTVQHKSAPDRRVLAEEHRRNISEAIKQKWADPQYRMRATSGMRGSVVQDKRAISVRVNAAEKSRLARSQLSAARARHDKLTEAHRSVEALQAALEAGQLQAEALRGDPEGFARQQLLLDDARKLVTHAQAKVAELEANTPSLEEVAAELGAKSPRGNGHLTTEEQDIAASEFVKEATPSRSGHIGIQLTLADAPVANNPSSSAGQPAQATDGHISSGSAPSSASCTGVYMPSALTHSYRHGRLQQSALVSRANAATELQPA